MALASTSRTQLRYVLESTFGVTPVAGNGAKLRMTGESLNYTIGTETSKEIRSDRQKSDLTLVSAQAQGGVNFELSYREYDPFLEAVAQGTWAAYGTNGVGTTFSATFTATTITAGVAPTGNSAFTTLAKGQWIRVNAPADVNNGKFVKFSESVAPTSTIITLDAATPLSATGPVAGSSIATSRLVNGTTQRSFSLEKEFSDITQFFGYRGMTASKLDLSMESGSFINGSLDFLGKDGYRVASTSMPGTVTESLTHPIMNAVDGIGTILEGGSVLANTFIKSLKLSYDNKLRGQSALGVLGNAGIGSGTIELTGSMEVYLADGTLYDKFVNNTGSKLAVPMKDGNNNGYVITLPNLEYSDAKVSAGGLDQDAMLTVTFEALRDTVTGSTLIIDRLGAAS